MQILDPVNNLGELLRKLTPPFSTAGEIADDEFQRVALLLGRSRVSYDSVWEAAERNYPKWTPVLCNSYRRALLLSSSAIQHRTRAFQVQRRGRMVLLRPVQEARATA